MKGFMAEAILDISRLPSSVFPRVRGIALAARHPPSTGPNLFHAREQRLLLQSSVLHFMGMNSGRFAMAMHALAVLGDSPEGATSAWIAGSVNTHAVFLRKVLRQLVKTGFVEVREGRGGRYWLARPAHRIRLSEVYEAIEPDGPLAASEAEPCSACPIGGGMRKAFAEVASSAREALLKQLGRKTVADLLRAALEHGAS